MTYVKTHVVARRNARGGRSAEEHLVAALRCLYARAVDDGLITEAGNPARKVAKPRRLPSTRRAVPDTRLAEINKAAAATGDDPELDTLLLRLHTETACRRGGALALRPADLDPDECLIPAAGPDRSVRQDQNGTGREPRHGRGNTRPGSRPAGPRVDQARMIARRLAAAGKPVSRRRLRSGGVTGSNEALNALARTIGTELIGGAGSG